MKGQETKRESFIFYKSLFDPIKDFSMEQLGELFKGICVYQFEEKEPELSPAVGIAFNFIREAMIRDNKKFQEKCAKNRENVKKRWNRKDTTVFDPIRPDTKNTENENENENENDIKRKIYKKKFQKPSVEEIREYCQERGNFIDPEQFFDFYEAKGWKIGKESMKDWKAAVRTWEKNRGSSPPPEPRDDSGLDEIAARKAASDKAYEEACAR